MRATRPLVLVAALTVLSTSVGASGADVDDPAGWAYPSARDYQPAPDDGTPRSVPDSDLRLPPAQVRNPFHAPDWRPAAHPPMPPVVASGRSPEVFACGFCHRAEGTGGPENASLAGLPAAYIVQQMADYRSGARSTAVPGRAPQAVMIKAAKAVSDDDVQAAALYFSSLRPAVNVRVVESATAPTTYVAAWFLAEALPTGREAIGRRIVEVPDDLRTFENRDPRATFTAYVPPGSVDAGRRLVDGQRGATTPCTTCHGRDLQGAGSIPPITGRSPTYVFRQLYEYKKGTRSGPLSALMKEMVRSLDQDDMIAIAAYLATLAP